MAWILTGNNLDSLDGCPRKLPRRVVDDTEGMQYDDSLRTLSRLVILLRLVQL
jgi:hypothetical protein